MAPNFIVTNNNLNIFTYMSNAHCNSVYIKPTCEEEILKYGMNFKVIC